MKYKGSQEQASVPCIEKTGSDGVKLHVQEDIRRKKVVRAAASWKCRKVLDIDGTTTETVRCGEETCDCLNAYETWTINIAGKGKVLENMTNAIQNHPSL